MYISPLAAPHGSIPHPSNRSDTAVCCGRTAHGSRLSTSATSPRLRPLSLHHKRLIPFNMFPNRLLEALCAKVRLRLKLGSFVVVSSWGPDVWKRQALSALRFHGTSSPVIGVGGMA